MEDQMGALMQILQPNTAAQESIHLKVSLMEDQLDPRVVDIQRQMEEQQSITRKQTEEQTVTKVLAALETQIRRENEWNASFQRLHDDMSSFESQLQQHTHVIRSDIAHVQHSLDVLLPTVDNMMRMMQTLLSQQNVSADNRALLVAMQSSSALSASVPVTVASSGLASWKYKFSRFERNAIIVDFDDESSILGEGASGAVHKAELRLTTHSLTVAFKRFNIPTSLKKSLRQIQAMNTTELLEADQSASSSVVSSSSSGSSNSSSKSVSSIRSKDPTTRMIGRVIRKARIAWTLNGHNNCVALIGVCLDPSSCGILLEYCSDGSLQDKLYQSGPEFERAADDIRLSKENQLMAATQIISALHFLHAKGVVHRDLKTPNVLVHNVGTSDSPLFSFKLNDFGSAGVTSEYMSSFSNTTGGSTAFTPRWEPPEIQDIDDSISDAQRKAMTNSPAVDIYALGCVLAEIFVFKPPYFNQTSDREVRRAQQNVKVSPFVWSEIDKIDEQLGLLIQQCCQREPKLRPTISEIHYQRWPLIVTSIRSAGRRSEVNSVQSAIKEMKKTSQSAAIYEKCLRVIKAKHTEDNVSCLKEINQHNAFVEILSGITRFPFEANIQEFGWEIIAQIIRKETIQNPPKETDITAILLKTMQNHSSDTAVLQQCFTILTTIYRQEDNLLIIAQSKGIETIAKCMAHSCKADSKQRMYSLARFPWDALCALSSHRAVQALCNCIEDRSLPDCLHINCLQALGFVIGRIEAVISDRVSEWTDSDRTQMQAAVGSAYENMYYRPMNPAYTTETLNTLLTTGEGLAHSLSALEIYKKRHVPPPLFDRNLLERLRSESIKRSTGADIVNVIMKSKRNNEECRPHILSVISKLSAYIAYSIEIAESGAISFVLNCLQGQTEMRTRYQCTSILLNLLVHDRIDNKLLINGNAMGLVLNVLTLADNPVLTVQYSCNIIHRLITERNNPQQIDQNGLKLLLAQVSAHPKRVEISESVCAVFRSVTYRELLNDDNFVVEIGAIESLVSAMKNHKSSVEVQESGWAFLEDLSKHDHILGRIVQAGGIEAAIDIIQTTNELKLLRGAYSVLCKLSAVVTGNGYIGRIVSAGGVQVAIQNMSKTFQWQNIVEPACILLHNISDHNEHLKIMAEAECVPLLIQGMKSYPRSLAIQEHACATLKNLAIIAGDAIVAADGVSVVTQGMYAHRQDPYMQVNGVQMISALCSSQHKDFLIRFNGISAVTSAMAEHPTLSEIQSVGCCALWRMLLVPIVVNGNAVVSLVISSMLRHPADASLQKNGSVFLLKLTEVDRESRAQIKKAGGIDAMKNAIAAHGDVMESAKQLLALLKKWW